MPRLRQLRSISASLSLNWKPKLRKTIVGTHSVIHMQTQGTYKRRKKAYKFGEQPEGVEILKNVTLLSSDKKQEESFNRLIYIPHSLRLEIGMLLVHANQFRKISKQTFNYNTGHVHILSRHKHCKKKTKINEKDTLIIYKLTVESFIHSPFPDLVTMDALVTT